MGTNKMFNSEKGKEKEPWRFPYIGARIVKTGIAVFLCLLICRLRGLYGQTMSAEAAITAIICMQPFVRDSREFAINRFAGTLIGSVWGLLFLLLLNCFPVLGSYKLLLYILMAVGVVLSLYSAVLIRQSDTASLAAIVFICIVIAFPDIEDPLLQAGNRFLDVLIGTGVAIGVNVARFPRNKNRNIVFFLQTKDLVPDRFSQIGRAVLFRINYLYKDGARICLMSEHAPAFFVSQMSVAKVNTPMIVMDGAAIFDLNENCFLYKKTIPTDVSVSLRERMDRLGVGYFVYTVHRDKTCVFYHGEMSEQEQKALEVMKRSPYRSYLKGEIYDSKEVVYYKIMDTKERLAEILTALSEDGESEIRHLRPVIRAQKSLPGIFGLYLYSENATMETACDYLMEQLRAENPELTIRQLQLKHPYRSERDAIHLLFEVERYYAPVKRPWKQKKAELPEAAGIQETKEKKEPSDTEE